jgi:hypothetical protein
MDTDLRSLLSRVASGDVSPDEAARLLDDLPADDLGPQTEPAASPAAPSGPKPAGRRPSALERVAIRSEGVRLTVLGDPDVAEAVVLGQHRITREGAILTIDTGAAAVEGYSVSGPALPRWLAWLPTGAGGERVTVRMNPALALSIDALGSLVEVRDVQAGLTASVSGAKFVALDVAGPLDVRAMTAHVLVRARLDAGESAVSSELSNIDVRLLPGSDVRVAVRSELGSATVSGGPHESTRSDDLRMTADAVVGAGTGSLTVNARMGRAEVTLP